MWVHMAQSPDAKRPRSRGGHHRPARLWGRRGVWTYQTVCADSSLSLHSGAGESCTHSYPCPLPAEGNWVTPNNLCSNVPIYALKLIQINRFFCDTVTLPSGTESFLINIPSCGTKMWIFHMIFTYFHCHEDIKTKHLLDELLASEFT